MQRGAYEDHRKRLPLWTGEIDKRFVRKQTKIITFSQTFIFSKKIVKIKRVL